MFNFAWPWCFILLPLPLFIYFGVKQAKQEKSALLVPFFDEFEPHNSRKLSFAKHQWLRILLLSVIWLLLVIAAARPQWVGDAISLPLSGRDVLLAVDISESMIQEDMTINNQAVTRLDAVKNVVADFIERRQGDRLGLVLFGTNAYLQTPLTFDTTTVASFLNEAQLGFAGVNTAIGEAIGLSVKRLQSLAEQDTEGNSTNANERVIILLTDGANTAGEISPVQAAQLAGQLGIKIYTIGIGAEEMIVGGFFGPRRINPSAQLDEVTLRAIASTTGAEYFRATNTDELNNIYEAIDSLEPISQDEKLFRPTRSLFTWPLMLALTVVLLNLVTQLIRKRKLTKQFTQGSTP